MEDKDLEFIKQFSKISISRLCRENKINRSNLLCGRSTKKNSKKIKKAIMKEYRNCYEVYYSKASS